MDFKPPKLKTQYISVKEGVMHIEDHPNGEWVHKDEVIRAIGEIVTQIDKQWEEQK